MPMQRKDLETAVASVSYLRGLLALPLAGLFLASGLGNLRWGPFRSSAFFIGVIAVLALAAFALYRHYNNHYGRVSQLTSRQIWYSGFLAVPMIGGSIVDSVFDVPVSLFTVLFAVAMLVWFGVFVGLQTYQWVVWGALLLVGLAPVWGSLSDKVSVAWLPISAAVAVAGVLDHRALVRTFGPARGKASPDHVAA
jgi:MFS family permease